MRQKYQAEEQQLRAKMAELRCQRRDQDILEIENSADQFEQIQAAVERDLLVGLLNHDAQLRADVRRAFDLMESGIYGLCEDCGEKISAARMKAIPWARRCVHCQDVRDRHLTDDADFLPEAA